MGLRDYGLGDIKVEGAPRFERILEDVPGCPHCGCASIAIIKVNVVDGRLHGGRGVGTFQSCVACPWASPMTCVATRVADAGPTGSA